MITEAEKFENVQFFFEHKVLKADPNKGTLLVERYSLLRALSKFTFENVLRKQNQTCRTKHGDTIHVDANVILACDGAFSAVRRSLMAYPLFQYSQEYIEHGYVELNILPLNNDVLLSVRFHEHIVNCLVRFGAKRLPPLAQGRLHSHCAC